MKIARIINIILILAFIGSCTHSVSSRVNTAQSIALNASLNAQTIHTDGFTLQLYQRLSHTSTIAHIYIEGDGYAWADRHAPSLDPTPKNPLALKLAAQDSFANVIYLARPCQYIRSDRCDQKYWTSHRFAPDIIETMSVALDTLKTEHGLTSFHLIGFSGGANIAALLTAQRSDILSLRTVAGNLDHITLHRHHNVTQTPESLNAVDIAAQIKDIPQHHFIGEQDKIVPPHVVQSFIKAAGDTSCLKSTIIPNATHQKLWPDIWPALLNKSVDCQMD